MSKIKNLKVYEKCLIVVDMVNGFVREGVLHDDRIAFVIPNQVELINQFQDEGELVVFIKDTHDENAVEFKRFGNTKHCVRGTKEAQLVDELIPFEGMDNTVSIEKNSTSFMESPKFRDLVSSLVNVKQYEIVGCCTDICDFNGAMGLANYCDEWNRDVEVLVHQDAIATYSEDIRREYVDAAYLLMKQQGIKLVRKK